MASESSERGVSLIEGLAVLTILGIMLGIAVPSLSSYSQAMRASEQKLLLSNSLTELRAEAIRLRRTIAITFSPTGFDWDIVDEGSETDGQFTLESGNVWDGENPGSLSFNGLGFVREIPVGNRRTIRITRGDAVQSITLNRNGYIE